MIKTCFIIKFLKSVVKLGKQMASKYLRQARTLFKGVLDIEDELILVDARNEKSEGFEVLKNVLKKQREEIIVSIITLVRLMGIGTP